MSPLVTVLMPVHNGEAFLSEAISSIIQQSFNDFEFLIIDDASTDASVKIVLSFRDPRIRLIRTDERIRICRALNLGLEKARGRYIARMDADDISHKCRLAAQVRFMEQRSEIGMCGTCGRRIKDGKPAQSYRRPTGFENIRAYALFDNPFIHASMMIRHQALERNHLRYDETFTTAQDYDLWVRSFDFFPSENLRQKLIDSREHDKSITHNASSDSDEKALRIAKRFLDALGLTPNEEDLHFHRQLGTLRWPVSPNERTIVRAEKWLLSLIDRNRHAEIFEPGALKRAVDSIWFGICYHGIPLGSWVIGRFLRSPLNKGHRINPLNTVLFMLAALKYRLARRPANRYSL